MSLRGGRRGGLCVTEWGVCLRCPVSLAWPLGSLKVGAGVRGKARLCRALKAVVMGRGLFLRAVGAMGGFKEAQLRRRRFRFVMWSGGGGGAGEGRGKRETGEQEGGCRGCQETGTVTQSQQGR